MAGTGNEVTSLWSRKQVRNALVELLKDKPFEKITVQNILEATPVTRTTFYKHFRDKYEIAELMQRQCVTTLNQLRQELGGVDIHDYHKVIMVKKESSG